MSIQQRFRLVVTAAVACVAVVVSTVSWHHLVSGSMTGPAAAAAVELPTPVTTDLLPTPQIDGVVWAQRIVGSRVYAGGDFSSARPFGAALGTDETPRHNLLAYDVESGELVDDFAPTLNGAVTAVAGSPDGRTVYVGGLFTTVDEHKRYRLAAFDAATGELVAGFAPVLDYRVAAIDVTDDTVFFGGKFSSVNGQPRTNAAAVDAQTGELRPFAPSVNAAVMGIAVSPDEDKVVLGGSFSALNGSSRLGWGAADADTGATLPWASHNGIQNNGRHAAVTSIRSEGDVVYASAYSFGFEMMEGRMAARWDTGELVWAADTRGDTHDVLPMDNVLYSVGHAHDFSSVGGKPDGTTPNYQFALAETMAASPFERVNAQGGRFPGVPAPEYVHWLPRFVAGTYTGSDQAGYTLDGDGEYLVVGGEFTHVMFRGQQGLARFAVRDTAPLKVGPRDVAGVSPLAEHLGEGKVAVTYRTAWDPDSSDVEYVLSRNGREVASEKVSGGAWWNFRRSTLTDVAPDGDHRYAVTVRDEDGNAWVSPAQAVTVTGSPVVDTTVTAVATAEVTDQTVTLDASGSRTEEGKIVSYEWDFGDGTTGDGVRVEHTYAQPSKYQVTLTVTTDEGLTGSTRLDVAAQGDNAVPVADFSVVASDLTVALDASASSDPDDGDLSYAWDFGDGTTATGVTVSHTFAAAGQKYVSLTVTDERLGAATRSETVLVTSPPAQSYADQVRLDGAAYHWRFSETSGQRMADLVGGNDIWLDAATASGAGVAGALAGTDDTGLRFEPTRRTRVPGAARDYAPLPQEVAVEAWVNTTKGGAMLVNAGTSAWGDSWFSDRELLLNDTGQVAFRTNPGREVIVTSPEPVTDGTWHHVVGQATSEGTQLFVDGVLVAESSTPGASGRFGRWRIGGDRTSHVGAVVSGKHFTGTLDEVAVYERPLTADQVVTHYNTGRAVATHDTIPAAAFDVTATGLTVALDASASAVAGGLLAGHQWSLGDGTTATGAQVHHTYPQAGTYPVALTVTAETGVTGVMAQQITVTSDTPDPVDPDPVDPEPLASAADSFTRSATGGWGNAESGGAYEYVGNPQNAGVRDGRGYLTLVDPGRTMGAHLPGAMSGAADASVNFAVAEQMTGGGTYVTLVGRRVGTSDYRARVRLFADGSASLVVQAAADGSVVTLAGADLPFAVESGDVVHLRLSVIGEGSTELAAMAWLDGEAPPATPQVTATDTRAELQHPGSTGVEVYLSRSATVSPVTVWFDDFALTARE